MLLLLLRTFALVSLSLFSCPTTGLLKFLTLSQEPLLACVILVVLRAAVWIAQYFVRLCDELEFLDIMRRSSGRRIWMVSLRQHQIGRPDDFVFGVRGDVKQRVVVRCHQAVPASGTCGPLPHRFQWHRRRKGDSSYVPRSNWQV